jgi:hypothetical protein
MTVEEITSTVRNSTKNLNFFDVVAKNPEIASNKIKIEAKTMDDLT